MAGSKIALLRTRILENNGIMGHDIFLCVENNNVVRVVARVVVLVFVRVVMHMLLCVCC
jgi:hypothetical protein